MSGIILAGGGSRRMGWDKALISIDGKMLIEHAAAALRQVCARVIIVADSADRYVVPDTASVADLYPGAGPVGGIVTGLRACGAGAHIVIACDMPFVMPKLLNDLVLRVLEEPPCDAVVPRVRGDLEPLCAVYCDTAAPKLELLLTEGVGSIKEALSRLMVLEVDENQLRKADPELRSFININTPEQLAGLIQGNTFAIS